jgi:hypothetical protein
MKEWLPDGWPDSMPVLTTSTTCVGQEIRTLLPQISLSKLIPFFVFHVTILKMRNLNHLIAEGPPVLPSKRVSAHCMLRLSETLPK